MICCLRGCGRVALYRGLCQLCYHRTKAMVKSGLTTWAKEIAADRAKQQIRGRDGVLNKEKR